MHLLQSAIVVPVISCHFLTKRRRIEGEESSPNTLNLRKTDSRPPEKPRRTCKHRGHVIVLQTPGVPFPTRDYRRRPRQKPQSATCRRAMFPAGPGALRKWRIDSIETPSLTRIMALNAEGFNAFLSSSYPPTSVKTVGTSWGNGARTLRAGERLVPHPSPRRPICTGKLPSSSSSRWRADSPCCCRQ